MSESIVNAPLPSSATVSDPRPAPASRRGYLRKVISRPAAIVGLVWVAIVSVAALASEFLSPYNPIAQDLGAIFQLPSAAHWLGTDQLGRDILSRLMFGAGDTLIGALTTVGVAVVIGLPVGVVAGYAGGWFDSVANRIADLLLTLPNIIVLLTVLAVFGNNIFVAMTALGVLVSAGFIRLARATTVAVRNELYVDAARVFGVDDVRILWRHILPNMIGPIVVQASITLGLGLLIQAGLGFLGLGTRPPYPSWGQMIAEASQQIYSQPWLMVPPGLAIVLTVLALNFVGDAARDSLPQAERGNLLAVTKIKWSPTSREELLATPGNGASDAFGVSSDTILSVKDLVVSFPAPGEAVDVVKGISFDLKRGTTTGLVGESGSGKTMTALALLGLVPAPGYVSHGSVRFGGLELANSGEKGYAGIRGKRIALISQEPMVALDPCFKVSTHLREALRGHRGMSRKQAGVEALKLLETVGMRDPKAVFDSYPHQLSGGMAQRVAIAWALAGEPELLIADEPTTALDVTVQAGILDLLRKLQADFGMTILMVTHDLGVVADICDEVVVMQNGKIVEIGHTEQIFARPADEYTRSLLGHAQALERDLGITA